MKRLPALHPLLFAIYPVLYLYSKNVALVSVEVTLVPFVVLLLLTFVLVKIASKIFDDKDAALVSVSGFFMWLFSYSAVRSMLIFEIGDLKFYRHRYFIIIWIIALIIFLVGLWKVRFNYQKAGKYLSILAPILVLISFFNIGIYAWKNSPQVRNDKVVTPHLSLPESVKADSLPDIYYIILDAYTGQQGLKQFLDIDNSEFVQSLRDRGFFVPEKSHSNYSWTSLSLSSSLNMEYLPSIPGGGTSIVSHIPDSVSEYDMITHNKVFSFLQSLGYEYIDLAIWKTSAFVYPGTYYNQLATSDFNLSLLRMTLLERPLVENYLLSKVKREQIIKRFDELRNLPPPAGPRFVHAHFLVPHHPYIFDKDGNELSFLSLVGELGPEKDLYREQLSYVNKEVQKTIDIILANSKRKPVIIIQGDHGAYQLGKTKLDNKKLRMSILNAYYVPESCKEMFYDTISPVNTFRIILNCYYGQNYTLLPDKSYYSAFENSRELEDVTNLLTGGE